jgi:hypothetical protein
VEILDNKPDSFMSWFSQENRNLENPILLETTTFSLCGRDVIGPFHRLNEWVTLYKEILRDFQKYFPNQAKF